MKRRSRTIQVKWRPWGPGSEAVQYLYSGKATLHGITGPLDPLFAAELIIKSFHCKTAIEIMSPVGIAGVYRMEQEPIPHAVEVPEDEQVRAAA